MSIYISTSCLEHKLGILKMLDLFKELGVKNVELGVSQEYRKDYKKILANYNFNFIVHHYFPPPRNPFVINLSSPNKKILEKSINQIKKSIDFCHDFNIDLFSFHAGFRIDPDINLKFNLEKIPSYERSFNIFKESVKKIAKYAKERNVKVAIENNVISEDNLIGGQNKVLLMCELWEFQKLFKEVTLENLGILLDLGHLKVSSHSLNFNRYNFIEKIRNKVLAIHIHENNGRKDEHKKIRKNSWCLEVINKWFQNKKIPLVMEGNYSNIKELINNKNLIEKSLR